ncbi:hypothetical protein HYG93_07410 [Acinetobacter sp. SwsAc6]|uniref:LamG-like jellyroll fold domain-containing protein n=1 Tax=Acinetobacter sp. SwsAc6 TaxID=2749439 RepID=UPI0015C175CA|nr:LamG-like jellyroll fold domain-containing protein [Acinetobacter sp. SwsAc6]NWK74116.1 hypothetical protein [Acinetobacter sp. SwsAc6]
MSEEKGIRLEFAQFGHFDSFEVFRSLTSMIGLADHELPAPIATGLKTMRFIDQINLKSVLDRDLYYRVRVIRGNQSLLSDELQTYISTFSAPQNLIVAFSNNALEIEWDFESVTELHYYCSESPIDPLNLPVPKAVLAGDVRTYVDTDIEVGKTYFVRVGSVKNGVEKISDEITVVAGGDPYFDNVVALLRFDGSIVNLKGTPWTSPESAYETGKFGQGFRTNANHWRTARATVSDTSQDFGAEDFTIDLWFAHKGVNGLWGGIFCKRYNSNNESFALFMPPGGTQVAFEVIGANGGRASLNFGSFTVGVFEFLSVERHGNILRALRNGSVVDLVIFTEAIKWVDAPFEVGRIDYNVNNSWSNCIIDELRVTKGVSRYKGTHVVPIEPFPNF